ncbi:hypothetical protein MHU86_6442 [Fragilaria crotonensis]|nr:hypothetical protein MHU86_6442 [Fragilaria crotonensis]
MVVTKTTRIGGPMLGHRTVYSRRQKDFDPLSWGVMEPLITSGDEQFILLPNRHFVGVVAYATGKKVASLVPLMEGETGEVIIESATLARYPRQRQNLEVVLGNNLADDEVHARFEEVLLVGCGDGTVREFLLASIVSAKNKSTGKSCGRYFLPGKCIGPRRVIDITRTQAIKHLSAPSLETIGGVVLYAIVETHADGATVHQKLCRVVLPPFDNKAALKSNLSEQVEIVEKYKCQVGRNEKKKKFENSIPFRLLMITKKAKKGFAADDDPDRDILIVVARANGLRVYHERLVVNDNTITAARSKALIFDTPSPLSAVTVSPNGNDIACGFWEGEMSILNNAFPAVVDYFAKLERGEQTKHPSHTILVRKMHWHAHPVTTLSYQQTDSSDPLLYSAGEESVLVVWQLARGTSKPADTLPRLAKGGVAHILAAGESTTPGILVFCEDNSLQLFQSHNLKPVWKLQGLAPCTPSTMIRRDGNSLLMSGLSGATGYLNWFNPRSHSVESLLEVVPFNRVSRTEDGDAQMPPPTITHTAFSDDMTQMVTVETVPTENPAIGRAHSIKYGTRIGVVTTIKFWAKTPRSTKDPAKPYFITASMTFPHGERHRISAVAMSRNGQYVCTVSNDEKAFRLWRQTLEVDEEDSSRRRPVWICQYKVSSPAGYANFDTPSQGVDFSSDGSTLCIAYGTTMTLWDHQEATLLNSLRNIDNEPIEQVQFVNTDLVHDSLLSRSKAGVKLQSPYGEKSKNGWSACVPNDGTAIITDAQAINGEQISITIYFPKERMSKILFVNTITGEPRSKGSEVEVPFKVQGVVLAGPRFERKAGFRKLGEDTVTNDEPPICVFVMSVAGELFLIQEEGDQFSLFNSTLNPTFKIKNALPRIHMPPSRKRSAEADGNEDDEPPTKKAAITSFIGEDETAPIATSELPFISGNFLRAFVGRNLAKREEEYE